jgi:RNA polymerase sigma factor (sigma-70 family)
MTPSPAERERLVLATRPMARTLALRYAGPLLRPDDAIQEAFVGLVEAAASYDPAQPWKPWARLWVLRRLFNAIRHAPPVRVPESAQRRGVEAPPVGQLRDAPAEQADPEALAIEHEARAQAGAMLTRRERQILSLRRAGYTLREVGEKSGGVSRVRALQLQHRALQKALKALNR